MVWEFWITRTPKENAQESKSWMWAWMYDTVRTLYFESESKLWRQPFLWFWIVANWIGNPSCVSSFLFAWSSDLIWWLTIWFWRQTVNCITQAESLRNSFSLWMFQHFIALKDLGCCHGGKMMVISKSSFTSLFHYQRGSFVPRWPRK